MYVYNERPPLLIVVSLINKIDESSLPLKMLLHLVFGNGNSK